MSVHSQAGKKAPQSQLVNVAKLVTDYYQLRVDPTQKSHQVSFGTSGHRGSSSLCSFNDTHIAAISQALSEYRRENGITGPMFIGKDTHALSEPAHVTAIEVLVANGVHVVIQENNGFTPTPVISHAIVSYNKQSNEDLADGIVITPSHNPPTDGGFKYNQTHGGPAGSDVTRLIQSRANEIIRENIPVKRINIEDALVSQFVSERDYADAYIEDLGSVIDMQAIADAGLKIGADPLGGSGIHYWNKIAKHYNLSLKVVNDEIDQRFSFMPCDKDGKIRMDCSSPFAMSGLISLKDNFDIAFGNDPDFDRHGIVCPSVGLMNPNHFLAVAISYLCQNRPDWSADLGVGKTLVSSSMIDRVVDSLGRTLLEMPVGFKWFVEGLSNSKIAFAGEESAGGIFLKRDGSTWATDKDGFILCLLAAEITAKTGRDPGQHYEELVSKFSKPFYTRIDVAATLEQKQQLSSASANNITASKMAGEEILNIQTHASGNNAAIGGVKVSTKNGWFAARPSGTENVYKIYAESFNSESHLHLIINEAENLVGRLIS